jgi:hypothetical protein
MATLEKKSPIVFSKLPHQQSLPTPKHSSHSHHHHHQLQQQMSAPAQTRTPHSGESMQVSIEQSDKSSLDSVEIIEHDCECDIGFGSMSSDQMMRQKSKAEQNGQQHKELDELKQEVTKLKCDKLDLLKQNVVSFLSHN